MDIKLVAYCLVALRMDASLMSAKRQEKGFAPHNQLALIYLFLLSVMNLPSSSGSNLIPPAVAVSTLKSTAPVVVKYFMIVETNVGRLSVKVFDLE